MWRFFAPELRSRLADLHAAASTAERVHAVLLETLPAGDHTMTTVAHHLATSPRTLQRQLQAEGTTFQTVLTGTREHLPRHYLTHSAMTTGEIAYLLAYDDTTSFYRAFRTWTGATPTPSGPATPAPLLLLLSPGPARRRRQICKVRACTFPVFPIGAELR